MAVIYLCPADKRLLCSWEGSASEIKQHFENEHNELLFRTNSIEIHLDKLPENKILNLNEEVYLVQTDIDDGKLTMKLRYLGSNEAASRLQYNICITINKISYAYDPDRYFSCVVPTSEGWQVDLECLEKYHGKIDSLTCTISLREVEIERKISETAIPNEAFLIERKISDASLNINNQFVEKNVCDETQEIILKDLSFLEGKLEKLKRQRDETKRKSGDYMDKISQLDFSLWEEESFTKHEDSKSEHEILPNIPEELNLSCSSCHLDMLPPIYLCINCHNVCSWCRSVPCKICSGNVTTTRNIDLENISRTHLHRCRYSAEGCNEKLRYNDVRYHEAKCNFCKYKCLTDDCPYEGKFDHFQNHLKVVHSSVKIVFSVRNEFPKNFEMYVVNKSLGIFYCKSEVSDKFLIWRATFCGPSERQFFCEISFKGSKYKEAMFLKRKGNVYEIRKPLEELKKNKAKGKYAVLTITSYDS